MIIRKTEEYRKVLNVTNEAAEMVEIKVVWYFFKIPLITLTHRWDQELKDKINENRTTGFKQQKE